MLLRDAETIAEWVRAELAPTCEQIEIAGSIRRRAPHPGDLEIVCTPRRPGPPVFGQGLPVEPLETKLVELTHSGLLIQWTKDGPRMKNFMVRHEVGSMQLDLFICRPPVQWGWHLLLRTGPADFTHWLVTPTHRGGGCPEFMKFDEGQLWRDVPVHGWTPIATPTEEDVFAAVGLGYRPPHQRLARWKGKAPA